MKQDERKHGIKEGPLTHNVDVILCLTVVHFHADEHNTFVNTSKVCINMTSATNYYLCYDSSITWNDWDAMSSR